MVNDPLPQPAKPAEIAGRLLPAGARDLASRSRQNFDSIEIAGFSDLAWFLQC
jgi:hypothetical protein